MILACITYLIVYLLFVGTIPLIGFFMHGSKTNKSDRTNLIEANDITVLVPFRNEEERIYVLLNSIIALNKYPKEIIFINDHSKDEGASLIADMLVNFPYRILTSPDNLTGKKNALRLATKECSTKYILTWDADIYFKPNYFNSLEKLPEADMRILPAVLMAKSSMEYLYEIDVILANAINTGLAGLKRPIIASGANLLYKREVFNDVDDLASHSYIASGDDTYLLRDFRNNKKDIRLTSSLKCAVYTETPKSFREFIDQRLRWVAKTMDIGDNLGTFVAMFQFILAITFFGLLGVAAFIGDWELFSTLFIGKVIADMVLFLPFFIKMRRLLTWTLIPIYEVLFPFYSLLLFILMFTYNPKWKGREIKSK